MITNRHIVGKFAGVVLIILCGVAFGAPQVRQSPSKHESQYPNELSNLKLHQEAKWKSLQPYVSTVGDVEKLLGKPVAVYDELLQSYVAGFQYDPNWTIVVDVIGEDSELPPTRVGRVLSIELHPKRRISLVGADFSAFRAATYTARDEETTSYYDKFGLRYVVFERDTANGRFHAGDLKRIEYGPSEEETKEYLSKAKLTRY